jgi:CheY-like chemotaxis protein
MAVLVVDDDEAFAYVVGRWLSDAGFDVIAAPDTVAALAAFDEPDEIDALVTDIRMSPGMPHGFALGRTARARRPGLPVIYMTAYPDLAKAERDETHTVLSSRSSRTHLPS